MRGIYIVGNYPDKDSFIKCFDAVINAGYEFVEIGVPFSEPVADGPVIASAVQEALSTGVKAADVLAGLKKLNKKNAKLYIMTYANIIYNYGIKKFSDDFSNVLSGLIIPDVPNPLHSYFYDRGLEIPIIPFVTPESREEDIKKAAGLKGDFIYFIGIRGTTGGSVELSSPEISDRIKQIKGFTDKKIVMGFGIKDKTDADKALSVADGFVVGTAAVKHQKNTSKYTDFVNSLI
jgi:tryptophan synthase alpha chain